VLREQRLISPEQFATIISGAKAQERA